ncbi:MAG: hypothetical protein PHR66_05925 [Desulfuromonadaceae bacterium]|nr:hypothetical protein [Desulfuromonadaceae bacterium]
MRRVIRACGVVCIAMISSGCSTVSKSYGKDGRGTHIIRCDAADSLSVCREQAKAECPRGYTTISETTGVNRKEIRVICKNQVYSVTKGTSSGVARAVTPP